MRSTEEWRVRAEQDALWAVASHAGKEGAWSAQEFYELGRSDWADFRRQWEQYLGHAPHGTCVEIGSGAGRMTVPLAGDFEKVIGLDVSDHMIRLAQEAAPSAVFHQVDDTRMPLADESADAVFSCHVLQHFETEQDVRDSLAEGYRVLRNGGTIMVHLIVREDASPLAAVTRQAKVALKLRLGRGKGATVVRTYSPSQVRDMLNSAGFGDVELREFATASNGAPHAFWLGRK